MSAQIFFKITPWTTVCPYGLYPSYSLVFSPTTLILTRFEPFVITLTSYLYSLFNPPNNNYII